MIKMLRHKANQGTGATAPAGRAATIVDASYVTRVVGEQLIQKIWPIEAEVLPSRALPAVIYPEDDFWRVMEILIGRALTASPLEGTSPYAVVGSKSDASTIFFSVRTSAPGAFKNGGEGDIGDMFNRDPELRIHEASAIVEKNDGRFWVDE